MDRFTRSIAMTSARRPWRTIAAWVLVMGTLLFVGASAGGTFTDDFAAPGSESERAMELLNENFPEAAKGKALVVFAAEDGESLASHREAIASVLTDVATFDHVESVADPFEAGTRLGGRPDRLRRADPRRSRAGDREAGVRGPLRCRRRIRRVRRPGRARR